MNCYKPEQKLNHSGFSHSWTWTEEFAWFDSLKVSYFIAYL